MRTDSRWASIVSTLPVPNDLSPMTPTERLLRLLLDNGTVFLCDDCIALKGGFTLQEARNVIAETLRTVAIVGKTAPCYGCGRTKDVFGLPE
jgi:hypothetical protein